MHRDWIPRLADLRGGGSFDGSFGTLRNSPLCMRRRDWAMAWEETSDLAPLALLDLMAPHIPGSI